MIKHTALFWVSLTVLVTLGIYWAYDVYRMVKILWLRWLRDER